MGIKRSGDYLIGDTRNDIGEAYQDMFKTGKSQLDTQKAADMMKKLLEMEDLLSKAPKKQRTISIDRLEASLAATKAQMEQLQKEQEVLNKAVAYAATLPFKVGDAGFHKDYGNVLIGNILLNDSLNEENTFYVVITAKGSQKELPMKEVVPITEATKILFGKK